ncbi:MAG: HAD family hydrolase [Firmicutes bacterium]|nr:HAD family hydrolase [Bacillota bacterium]
MKRYEAILIDLDGTLLPMDQDVFVERFFAAFCEFAGKLGYDKNLFKRAMQSATFVMSKNDGRASNDTVFWNTFSTVLGSDDPLLREKVESFYHTDFAEVKSCVGREPLAAELIKLAHEKAGKVVLATNPLFPACAITARLNWAGLDGGDFDHITDYCGSKYCKPDPRYFADLFAKLKVNANNCLMIGNDVAEDAPAADFGADVFLLDRCLITHGLPVGEIKHGDINQLMAFLRGS